jgi:uncharacterized membrane protein YgdD (TMEM256/DUF423 family)
MNKYFLTCASISGALSVGLGAFAAHGLRSIFPPESISIFETGVRYQFYHTFALFAVVFLEEKFPESRFIVWAGNCFIAGIILFSGSLYLLAAVKAGRLDAPDAVGIITPFGGICFLAGWILLIPGVWRKK